MLSKWLDSSIRVIPAVDVLGEGAVRLHRGDYAEIVDRAGDPVALARRFASEGASRIHLVDLDGARSGRARPDLVRRVAGAAAPAALQASGGIRSLEDAFAILDAGADRVVVGTAAFPDPAPWAAELGGRLVVALDVRDGMVRTAGWTQESGLTRERAVELCLEAGVVRVLCTAIDRDGTLSGPDLALVESVAACGLAVLAAGGVRSPDDVEELARAGAEAAGDTTACTAFATAADQTQGALDELRELAHGIYPAVLAEAGIAAALATLADTAPLPVEILQTDDRRCPAAAEAAAYFTVAEAVDDAACRGAGHATVTVVREGGQLIVTIQDDGAARAASLVTLADRVGALGGSLLIQPTSCRAEIPCVSS